MKLLTISRSSSPMGLAVLAVVAVHGLGLSDGTAGTPIEQPLAAPEAAPSAMDFITKAKLTDSSFVGADLRNARLYRADLTGADLTDAKLDGADITRAILDGATWTDGKTVCAKGSVGRCNWR